MPPQRLLISTGTLVSMTVLVVTKMNETAVILINDVGRTLIQLCYISVVLVRPFLLSVTYKLVSGLEVIALGMGATAVRNSPTSSKYFPLKYSSSLPVPMDAMKPMTPIGRNRRAVSPDERLSTCCAIKTM